MNGPLDMNRFWLLVRRQWTENKKVHLLLWGVISLCLVFTTLAFDHADFQVAIFYWVFGLGGCAMTMTLFSRWPDFGRSSFYLLLPASSNEKFLCGIFYSLILFIPLYGLNFVIVRSILIYVLILPFSNHMGPFLPFIQDGIRESTSVPLNHYIFPLLTFLLVQSLLMIIILSFRKNHALIFIITVLLILVIYNLLMKPLMSGFGNIPQGSSFSPGVLFPHFNLGFGLNGRSGFIIEHFTFIKKIWDLNNLIWLVISFLLYMTAGYKLKEREL